MKNFFLVLVFAVLCFGASQAQISFDGAISPNSNTTYLSIVRFGYMGDKYVMFDKGDNKLQIYNLNQVLEKNITIPISITTTDYNIYFVTDNLFDLDSTVEYLAMTFIAPSNYTAHVLKEDSTILLSRDSVPYLGTSGFGTSTFNSVYPTASGTKLVLKQTNDGYDVYSLPGSLPCYECSNGVFTGNFSPTGQNEEGMGISNPYPNPTSNLTRIDYQLPNGIKQGELVFYNTMGTEMKRFKVPAPSVSFMFQRMIFLQALTITICKHQQERVKGRRWW